LVDKPGRRKRQKRSWGKIAAVLLALLVVGGVGWYVYGTYLNRPAPVYARIGTNFGSFDVELFPACAPKTVANFVSLAQSGFYNNLVWHRIVTKPNPFVIQTGDPNTRDAVNSTRPTWGQGGSSQTVPLEICDYLHNYAGYLGMARSSSPDSGTSQFYVNLSNSTTNTGLDGSYAVFGKVIAGMKVVCAISKVPTYSAPPVADQPVTPVYLKNVTIISAVSASVPQPIVACT
jgi:cyclophilin family peptidyl-prolyl cis-trans isomerase